MDHSDSLHLSLSLSLSLLDSQASSASLSLSLSRSVTQPSVPFTLPCGFSIFTSFSLSILAELVRCYMQFGGLHLEPEPES